MARKETPLPERLLAKAVKRDNGCWEWVGHTRLDGYGLIWRGGKAVRAHRVSYELFCGDIADEDVICHRCDNPRCINPSHLFKGTRLTNNQDAAAKGRQARGERNGHAKLTSDDIAAIRAMRGVAPQQEIAQKFGIHQGSVSQIQTGRRWKHLVHAKTIGE